MVDVSGRDKDPSSEQVLDKRTLPVAMRPG